MYPLSSVKSTLAGFYVLNGRRLRQRPHEDSLVTKTRSNDRYRRSLNLRKIKPPAVFCWRLGIIQMSATVRSLLTRMMRMNQTRCLGIRLFLLAPWVLSQSHVANGSGLPRESERWSRPDSNWHTAGLQPGALPIELRPHFSEIYQNYAADFSSFCFCS